MRFYVLDESTSFKARKIFPPANPNRLTNWDFHDESLNGSLQQINRQKSALNQTVAFLDAELRMAGFEDSHDGFLPKSARPCSLFLTPFDETNDIFSSKEKLVQEALKSTCSFEFRKERPHVVYGRDQSEFAPTL